MYFEETFIFFLLYYNKPSFKSDNKYKLVSEIMSSDLTEPATDKSAAFTHKPTESNFFRIKLENDPEETFKAKRDYSERYTKQTFNESIKKQIVIDDYKSEMVQNFSKFRSESLFTDIFIYVDGVEFPCHKVVLCAASLYFKAMFSCDLTESRHGKVFIENISPWTMKRLLDFIYTGKLINFFYRNRKHSHKSSEKILLNLLAKKIGILDFYLNLSEFKLCNSELECSIKTECFR